MYYEVASVDWTTPFAANVKWSYMLAGGGNPVTQTAFNFDDSNVLFGTHSTTSIKVYWVYAATGTEIYSKKVTGGTGTTPVMSL
jgi:outer membrane protein assembly factor BamB